MIKHEIGIGTTPEEAAGEMLEIANDKNETVWGIHNDIMLTANPGDSVKKITSPWYNKKSIRINKGT